MNVQNKFSMDGNGTEGVAQRRKMQKPQVLLRVLGLVLTLVAAIVVGVDRQTKVVPLQLVPSLPAVNVPVEAKWHHLSAFVYFVIANAIASAYAAISLILSITNKGGNRGLGLMISIVDLLMVALLFSSGGAMGAVGLLGYEGNSHVQWRKVCNVFGKFCSQLAAGLVLSLLGAIAFLLLEVLVVLNFHRRAN